jgi:hypothetical protein
VSAHIPQGVQCAVYIREHDTLAIDRDKLHFARRQIAELADDHKAF